MGAHGRTLPRLLLAVTILTCGASAWVRSHEVTVPAFVAPLAGRWVLANPEGPLHLDVDRRGGARWTWAEATGRIRRIPVHIVRTSDEAGRIRLEVPLPPPPGARVDTRFTASRAGGPFVRHAVLLDLGDVEVEGVGGTADRGHRLFLRCLPLSRDPTRHTPVQRAFVLTRPPR